MKRMIVIKDMEMPKKCGECDIYVCYRTWHGDPGDEFCGLTKKDVNYKTKPEWCPLSEVPERKTGKWIEEQRGIMVTEYRCSECGRLVRDDTGYDVDKDYPFCHCGADMRGEDHDEG